MAPAQDLEVQQKRELEKKDESTIPARVFLPNTDIIETEDTLTVVMEMPGVNREHADITVEDNVLSVASRIDFSKYEKLQPVHTEYNVGHYRRSFNLSPNSFDEHKIGAEMKDGVLTLTLPKAERGVADFLKHTKTFHDLFAVFGMPSLAPIVTFLVSWGHLLIGLSLLVGFMVRVSASFGIMLMLV